MAARLGDVLYWAAIALALIPLGLAVYIFTHEGQPGDVATGWVLVIIAAVILVIGRACRYVLAGR